MATIQAPGPGEVKGGSEAKSLEETISWFLETTSSRDNRHPNRAGDRPIEDEETHPHTHAHTKREVLEDTFAIAAPADLVVITRVEPGQE